MLAYAGRRLLLLVPTLLAISVAVFLLIHLIPGDPAQVMLGERATPAALAALRAELGLGDPLWVQYGRFLGGLLRGDLGRSLKTHEKVSQEIAVRFPATLELALAAMGIAAIGGIGLGILAASRHRTLIDQLTMGVAVVGVSMPIFWLGLMLMLLFGVQLGWLPIAGRLDTGLTVERMTGLVTLDALLTGDWHGYRNALAHLALPALALATIPMAVIARMTRSSVLEALRQDYVRTARAKGLAEPAVVLRHAVRNAFLPTLTVLGLQFGSLLGGAIITETIFAWPGVGRWLLLAVHARDFQAVQGGVLVIATTFVVVNLIVDLGYSVIDPRVRHGQ
jgi:peptide/nickel transport system permease protein